MTTFFRSWRGVLLRCLIVLMIGCSGATAVIWTIHNLMRNPPIPTHDELALRVLDGHTDRIHQLGFSPDGSRLVSVSSDRTAKVWNVDSWTEVCTFRDHKYGVMSLALCQNCSFAVTGDGDSGVILWDMDTCRQKSSMTRRTFIRALAFDPDEANVLVVAHHVKSSLVRWNYNTGAQRIVLGEWDNVVSATLPTLGQVVITSGTEGSIVIWNKSLTKKIQTLPIPCSSAPKLSSVSRNGRLAAYCYSRSAIIWDLIAGKKVCDFKSPLMNTVSSICLSSSGDYLVLTGCVFMHEPGVIELIDANSGHLIRTLRAHEGAVDSSAFSPDERFLATGGALDHSIKIWSLQDLLREKKRKKGVRNRF